MSIFRSWREGSGGRSEGGSGGVRPCSLGGVGLGLRSARGASFRPLSGLSGEVRGFQTFPDLPGGDCGTDAFFPSPAAGRCDPFCQTSGRGDVSGDVPAHPPHEARETVVSLGGGRGSAFFQDHLLGRTESGGGQGYPAHLGDLSAPSDTYPFAVATMICVDFASAVAGGVLVPLVLVFAGEVFYTWVGRDGGRGTEPWMQCPYCGRLFMVPSGRGTAACPRCRSLLDVASEE